MAKPDCDDGWVKLADELLAAIFVADFAKREMIVLREVFEQCYGDDKKEEAYLDPVDIAQRSGTPRQNIWKALTDLSACHVLVPVGGYRYRFNKDYEAWTRRCNPRLSPRESARLSPRECEYAQSAPERAHRRRKRAPKPSPNGATKPPSISSTRSDDPSLHSDARHEAPSLCSDARTIEERARALRSENQRSERSNNQRGGGPAPSEREYPPDVEGDRIAAEAREVAREWGWPEGVVEWAADMAPLKDDWPMFRAALIHGAMARDRIVEGGKQVASPERLIESKYRQFEDEGRAPADPIRPDSRRAAEEAESLHRRMYPLYRAPRDPEREAKQRSFEEKLRARRAGGVA